MHKGLKELKRKQEQFKTSFFNVDVHYQPLCDKHLQYFFANKGTRQVLKKNKVINRKNEILQPQVNKLVKNGLVPASKSFRVKARTSSLPFRSLKPKPQIKSSTIEKKDFQTYLDQQLNRIKLEKAQLLYKSSDLVKSDKKQQ